MTHHRVASVQPSFKKEDPFALCREHYQQLHGRKYAQIEKELLAIVFACAQYVYARVTKVETAHKPLEAISRKNMMYIPKRLQRMVLRLQRYDLQIAYKKGSEMYVADTLSRVYLQE